MSFLLRITIIYKTEPALGSVNCQHVPNATAWTEETFWCLNPYLLVIGIQINFWSLEGQGSHHSSQKTEERKNWDWESYEPRMMRASSFFRLTRTSSRMGPAPRADRSSLESDMRVALSEDSETVSEMWQSEKLLWLRWWGWWGKGIWNILILLHSQHSPTSPALLS
jgi:hypothetical protein